MKSIKKHPIALSVSLALSLVCAGLLYAGIGIARTPSSTKDAGKDDFHARLRRGVGSEVRFASAGDSAASVEASVASVASFIYNRSNMNMSEDTKRKLAKAEQDVLNGKSNRLSVSDLTDALTEIAADRLKSLTDDEIEKAVKMYRPTSEGLIRTRASAKWGFVSTDDFIQQVKALRSFGQNHDQNMQYAVHSVIANEINERVGYLSEALPEKFGDAQTNGVTPLQSVLLMYSVVADDPMNYSHDELAMLVTQYRKHETHAKGEKFTPHHNYDKAFGVNGVLYSSPVPLIFNKATVEKLINRAEGGKQQ